MVTEGSWSLMKGVKRRALIILKFIVLQFDCCGVEDKGFNDYLKNATNPSAPFPSSCCNKDVKSCPPTVGAARDVSNSTSIFKQKVSTNIYPLLLKDFMENCHSIEILICFKIQIFWQEPMLD